MTVDEFVKYFEPNQESIEILYRYYRRVGWDEAAQYVAPLAVAGVRAARHGTQRSSPRPFPGCTPIKSIRSAGEPDAALECAQKAVICVPNHYESRELLAIELATARTMGGRRKAAAVVPPPATRTAEGPAGITCRATERTWETVGAPGRPTTSEQPINVRIRLVLVAAFPIIWPGAAV